MNHLMHSAPPMPCNFYAGIISNYFAQYYVTILLCYHDEARKGKGNIVDEERAILLTHCNSLQRLLKRTDGKTTRNKYIRYP